jgi:hypothetical protein
MVKKIYIFKFPDSSPMIALRQNCLFRIFYGIIVFFIFAVIILSVIGFFLIFGCPFEFIRCYLNRNKKNEDYDNYIDNLGLYNNEKEKQIIIEEDEDNPLIWKDYLIIILLLILGIILQPFFILYYILYGFMELYRQFGCLVLFSVTS